MPTRQQGQRALSTPGALSRYTPDGGGLVQKPNTDLGSDRVDNKAIQCSRYQRPAWGKTFSISRAATRAIPGV